MTPAPSDHDLLMCINTRIGIMVEDVATMKDNLERNYVTQKEFAPVRAFVFSIIALICVGVGTALISVVVSAAR